MCHVLLKHPKIVQFIDKGIKIKHTMSREAEKAFCSNFSINLQIKKIEKRGKKIRTWLSLLIQWGGIDTVSPDFLC